MVVGLGRLCSTFNLLRPLTSSFRFIKCKSNAHIVMTDDNSVIVCWHPEKLFPYEKSLPLKMDTVQPRQSHSILKVQSTDELLSVLKPKKEEIVRKELMAVTHTVKHIWFPRKKQFRRKKPIDMDRPYL